MWRRFVLRNEERNKCLFIEWRLCELHRILPNQNRCEAWWNVQQQAWPTVKEKDSDTKKKNGHVKKKKTRNQHTTNSQTGGNNTSRWFHTIWVQSKQYASQMCCVLTPFWFFCIESEAGTSVPHTSSKEVGWFLSLRRIVKWRTARRKERNEKH